MEIATTQPAETMAWLYERHGPALQVVLVGADSYQPRLLAVTGYREMEGGIEVRYAANGIFVRVEVIESEDAVAVGVVSREYAGMHRFALEDEWAPVPLSAPLGPRRVRDAVSGRFLA